jgi:hypothetical protein
MANDRIDARVAKILTDRELVINKGSSAGVEVGMRFAILTPEGIGIVDPITGEELGDVERPKTLVKVTQIQEKLAVAATYRTKTLSGGAAYSLGMSALFAPPREVAERLRASESTYARPLKPEESIVNVGDRAVQVIGDEFAGWDW